MSRLLLAVLVILFFVFSAPTILQKVLPLSFSELIVYYGNSVGVDPALIAAVIQVESSFRPWVVSTKGAVGLMQLMPETATWVAGQRGLATTDLDLTDPEINIQLGVYYLHYLLDRFPTETAALAAYNGGPTNVRRWLDEGVWDGSSGQASQIPFTETRAYVRKVGLRHRLYQFFYQEELKVERS